MVRRHLAQFLAQKEGGLVEQRRELRRAAGSLMLLAMDLPIVQTEQVLRHAADEKVGAGTIRR